ncbi:carbohydrate esterase family 1 protein [Xylariaceae sp. FL0016]|nr:carbohydrate esterase family 1 protein [Xylariaceae sp. FL0016]
MYLMSATSFILTLLHVVSAKPFEFRDETRCQKQTSANPGELKSFETAEGRQYQVWLPKSYSEDTAAPLILSYHGANRDIEHQVALDKLTDPYFNEDHMVVYLQGNADDPDEPDHTTWEGAPGSTSDDISFTRDVLDATIAAFCVDTDRIYATGKSQGGGFVGRLACDVEMSSRIAAYAPVSGAYYIKEVDKESDCHPVNVTVPCNASRDDIPIMAFHGGADDTIRYHGDFRSGACLPDIPHWARQWAERDGLGDAVANSSISQSDNGVMMRFGGGLVTLVYDGDDIGHDWPSTLQNDDNERKGHGAAAFNSSSRIMEFFRGHSLSGA